MHYQNHAKLINCFPRLVKDFLSPGRQMMMIRFAAGALFLLVLCILSVSDGRNFIKLPSEARRFYGGPQEAEGGADHDAVGTRWDQHQEKIWCISSRKGCHIIENKNTKFHLRGYNSPRPRPSSTGVSQRDADLLYFWHRFLRAPEGSARKFEARQQLAEALAHRTHIDNSFNLIGKLLFGIEKSHRVMNAIRPDGKPLVDDWNCLKSLVRAFEGHCGSLSSYGLKHMRSIANICNAGVNAEQMAEASAQACPVFPSNSWSSLRKGFSA